MNTNTMVKDSGHLWDGDRCLRCGDKDWLASEMCDNRTKKIKDYERYCSVCGHMITASNIKEFDAGEHEGYIYVHDDIPHSDDDAEAFFGGVQ